MGFVDNYADHTSCLHSYYVQAVYTEQAAQDIHSTYKLDEVYYAPVVALSE